MSQVGNYFCGGFGVGVQTRKKRKVILNCSLFASLGFGSIYLCHLLIKLKIINKNMLPTFFSYFIHISTLIDFYLVLVTVNEQCFIPRTERIHTCTHLSAKENYFFSLISLIESYISYVLLLREEDRIPYSLIPCLGDCCLVYSSHDSIDHSTRIQSPTYLPNYQTSQLHVGRAMNILFIPSSF